MLQPRATVCLLLSISLTCVKSAESGNFEDADRGSDYATSSFSDTDGQWDLRHSIPGEPEIDYPIYSIAPKTSFSCENRHEGYYADVETRCQVFRICTNTDLSGEGFAFLCPNGTLFSQKDFVCDWYRNVDCTESENYYFKNEEIGSLHDKDEVMKAVKEMVEFPMKTITKTIQKTTNASNSNKNQRISNSRYDTNQNRNQNGLSNKTGNRNSNAENHFKINIDNDTNVETQSKSLNNQSKNEQPHQNHRERNDQHNSENRNKQNGRKNNIDAREKQRTTLTNTNRDRISSNQSNKFPPPRVYVNSLGELSTDPGVNFDPKSSLIIEADQSSRRGKNRSREQKKSLDDVLGDRASSRNQVEIERREKLKQGLPGTDSKRIRVASKVKATYSKDKDGEQDVNNSERNASESKTKLNFAERINAGLNGFLASDSSEITGNGNNSNIPEFVRNFIDKKTNKKQTETKILEDDHERFLNLADNVNGGFLSNDQSNFHHTHVHKEYHLDKTFGYENENSNQRKQNRHPKIYSGEDNLSEPIQPIEKPNPVIVTPRPAHETLFTKSGNKFPQLNSTNRLVPGLVSNIKIGQAFQEAKTTESSITKPNIDEYRSGRQFQFFGSGFTKSGQTPVTLAPFNVNLGTNNSKTNYLPPAHVQPFISQLNSNVEKTLEIQSRISTKSPAIVALQKSTNFVGEQVSNPRKPKHQNISNRHVVRGPGTVSLRTSLPVQNIILTEETEQVKSDISKSLPQKEIKPATPSPFYLPQPKFTSRANQAASNIPDLFLMVGDINAAEETKPSDSSKEDVTVKRRAEALLVQGVQQAFFENEFNENSVENVSVQQNATQIFNPLVIHVDEDERKDSDVTNIEKLLVGNIRNFLRVGIENEIKSEQNLESATVKDEGTNSLREETTIVTPQIETTIISVLNNKLDQTTILNDINSKDYSTTLAIESEIFNTTEISPTTSTKISDTETTTFLPITTENLMHFSVTKQANSIKFKGTSQRRLTIKPINYSKKPYTVRTYPKTNTTTKPNKFTNNIKRRPLNRFALKDAKNNNTLTSTDTVPTSVNDADNDSNDLQAIANSYRSYRPTTTLNRLKIQNDTKYSRSNRYRSSNLIRNRYLTITTTPASIISAPIVTTVSSVNSSVTTSSSKTNISFTNLIPFDILSKAIHGNTETTNLQNPKNRFPNTQDRNTLSANETIRGTQKTYQTPQKALYTQIPGTNIKISKSNEEASFSFDPQIGLKPQPVSSSQQTGYVPLEQYITQTLSKTLSSPEFIGNGQLSRPTTITPSLQHITVQPTISTHSQNNHIFSFASLSQAPSSPSLPTLRPSVVNSIINNINNNNINNNQNRYTQQQPPSLNIIPSTSTLISQPSQINNLQPISNYLNSLQQATHTLHQQSSINLNNRGIFTSPSGVAADNQDNKQLIRQQDLGGLINNIQHKEQQHHFTPQYQTLPIPTSATSSFSFNQFGNLPPQPILLNSQSHQNNQASFEQFILDNAQRHHQLNNAKGYPPNQLAIFNEIPIAQRRFDLEDVDTRSGKSIYSGVSSYHVPLGSVGRLSGDIAATKRFRRSQKLFS